MLDQHRLEQVDVDLRRGHEVGDALAVVAEVEEHPVVAELEDGVDERDLAVELGVERDRGVDRDRRGADAALGAVERDHLAQRRAAPGSGAASGGAEARQQAAHPGQQLGLVERLDEVVVRAGAQAADLLLDLLLGGQHDDRDVALAALVGADLLGDPVAVELRQADVEQDQRGLLRLPRA